MGQCDVFSLHNVMLLQPDINTIFQIIFLFSPPLRNEESSLVLLLQSYMSHPDINKFLHVLIHLNKFKYHLV